MYRVEEVERDIPIWRTLLKATQVYREIQCISKNDSSTTSGCLLACTIVYLRCTAFSLTINKHTAIPLQFPIIHIWRSGAHNHIAHLKLFYDHCDRCCCCLRSKAKYIRFGTHVVHTRSTVNSVKSIWFVVKFEACYSNCYCQCYLLIPCCQ